MKSRLITDLLLIVLQYVCCNIKIHGDANEFKKNSDSVIYFDGGLSFVRWAGRDRTLLMKFLITTMIQPFRTTLKWFCSGGLNHGQKQGSISKKHEHSYLYSALWR